LYGRIAARENLQGFIRADSSYQGIGTGNGRNDVLSDAKSEHFSNAIDVELLCSCFCLLVYPLHVLQIVIVPHLFLPMLLPQNL
jgi:hypothetical protein